MQHAQGYTESHWTPPAAIVRLLAPYCSEAAGKTTAKKNTQNLLVILMAILMAMAMRRYDTACIAQWRRSMTALEATNNAIGRAFAPISSIEHAYTGFCFFSSSSTV